MKIEVDAQIRIYAKHIVEADDHAEAAEIVRDMTMDIFIEGFTDHDTLIFDTNEVPE